MSYASYYSDKLLPGLSIKWTFWKICNKICSIVSKHEKSTAPAAPMSAKTVLLMRLQGLEPWTNRLRVYCSTNWAKGAYFCFSVFHWMIHSLNTNKIIKDSAEKSNLFFTVSLLLLKTAKTGLIILLNFTIFSYISVCFDDGSNGSRTYFRFLSFFFKSFSSSCMDFWIL